MLTVDDIRAVPLFATLSPADLDRLVRSCADIRLNPGEFAVHEGGWSRTTTSPSRRPRLKWPKRSVP
jgi:hypothetical protein